MNVKGSVRLSKEDFMFILEAFTSYIPSGSSSTITSGFLNSKCGFLSHKFCVNLLEVSITFEEGDQ